MAASQGPSTVTPKPPPPPPLVSMTNSAGLLTIPLRKPGPEALTLVGSLPVRQVNLKGLWEMGSPPNEIPNRYSPS